MRAANRTGGREDGDFYVKKIDELLPLALTEMPEKFGKPPVPPVVVTPPTPSSTNQPPTGSA